MKFKEFNANPFNKKTGDCVIRAICTALNESWQTTYKGMFEIAITKGYAVSCKENYEYYLKQKGYEKQKMPRRNDNTRYTIKEFIDELATSEGIYVISIANHLTCIKNRTLYDLWDCSRKSVGNYWRIR